jgi:serine/threonine protein kinase
VYDPPMPLKSGASFAGFKIVRLLGSGGMGEVYLAEHPRLPRSEALKILPTEVSADAEFRSRFDREADLAATLYHPHIVGVHDRGESDGQLWISMDYVDGTDTAQLLRNRYPAGMPLDDAIEVISAIAEALDYAHDHGLLHRDVKPANILLTEPRKGNRRILLADFGIARSIDEISGLTATNMTVGTVNYAAPEQLMDASVDGRADQYSLAATAYHLLTGRAPFEHSNPAVVISHHLNAEPRPLSEFRPDLAELDAAFARALSKNPTDRFQQCQDFAAMCKPDAMPGTTAHATTGTAPTRPAPVSSPQQTNPVASTESQLRLMRPGVLIPAALAVLLVAALIIVVPRLTRGNQPGAATTNAASSTQNAISPPATAAPPAIADPSTQPSTAPPEDPRLSGPTTGSGCTSDQWNVTKISREGTSVRCVKGDSGAYTWSTDSGEQLDPKTIAEIGWDACNQRYDASSCVAAAQQLVGAPSTSVPVTTDGTWGVPSWMKYGDYAAAVGPSGTCWWYGYDSTGKVIDSGRYTSKNDQPAAFVSPFMTSFQTAGCTPWVMIKPISPDW